MEIDITEFFNNAAPMDYSASVAELGPSAARDTWRAANDDSEDYMLLDTEEKREAFRRYIQGFGAWNAEEIAAMSNLELNALLLQDISACMREVPDVDMGADMTDEDWQEYERLAERGTVSSRIFRGDIEGSDGYGKIFFYIGE